MMGESWLSNISFKQKTTIKCVDYELIGNGLFLDITYRVNYKNQQCQKYQAKRVVKVNPSAKTRLEKTHWSRIKKSRTS